MLIGNTVIYDGQTHVVIGFTPMSVTPARIQLRVGATGATFWVERRLIVEPVTPERAALVL